MTRKQIKQLENCWYSIENALGYTRDIARYLDQHETEERDHRNGAPSACYRAPISVPVAAKLMAVHYLLDALAGERVPTVADYFHILPSCFMAHALVARYRKDIEEALRGHDTAAIASWDYAEIMNPQVAA